jgi:hypothetical protein
MFAYGKIIYDVEGKVKELQDLALEYIDKPLPSITQDKLYMNNYRIWDSLDELKDALEDDSDNFEFIYYNYIEIPKYFIIIHPANQK